MYNRVLLYLLIWIAIEITCAQDVVFDDSFGGESCTAKDGGRGRCVDLKNCPEVRATFFTDPPVRCGFVGISPIICCPVVTEPVTEANPNDGTVLLIDISPPESASKFVCGRNARQSINFFSRSKRSSKFIGGIQSVPAGPGHKPEDPVIGGFESSRNAWPWMALVGARVSRGIGDGIEIGDVLGGVGAGSLVPQFPPGTTVFKIPDGVAGASRRERSLGVGNAPGIGRVPSLELEGFPGIGGNLEILHPFVDWFCGGVLINDQWVLTAAHCLDTKKPDIVRLGEHDFNNIFDGANHKDFDIAEIVRYPNYTFPRAYHDLALLKLKTKVKLQTFISPVCLPWGDESQKDLAGTKVKLTGWGDTQFAGNRSSALQEVDLTMFPVSRCERSYSTLRQFRLNWPNGMGEETACAGDERGGRDACQGDSGGPITYRLKNGRYAVNGIVSTGYGCGNKNFPGIYTNVQYPPHLAWIKRVAF